MKWIFNLSANQIDQMAKKNVKYIRKYVMCVSVFLTELIESFILHLNSLIYLIWLNTIIINSHLCQHILMKLDQIYEVKKAIILFTTELN